MNERSRHPQSIRPSGRPVVCVLLALVVAISGLAIVPPASVGAATSCARLTQSGNDLTGGSSDCYYVVIEASGDWNKACEGAGGFLPCNDIDAGRHKVDMYSSSPWGLLGDYYVTIPDQAQDAVLPAPRQSFATAYSSTAGEIGWLTPTGATPSGYRITENGTQLGANVRDIRSVSRNGLQAGTTYRYEVFAVYNNGESDPLRLEFTTNGAAAEPDDPTPDDPTPDNPFPTPTAPGNAPADTNGPRIQLSADDADLDGRLTYSMDFVDQFNSFDSGNWNVIDMSDALHRAGNGDLDADGNTSDNSVNGKRWSAWYNGDRTDVAVTTAGVLSMGGLYTNEADPTRQQHTHQGVLTRFDQHKFYTGFFSTWDGRAVDGAYQSNGTANRSWGPGTFVETRVSFEDMNTPGFRLSAWMMPADANAGSDANGNSFAYNASAADGVEIDIFEFDPAPTRTNTLLMKVIGGGSGSTPNDQVTVAGIDNGYHRIGLLWLDDRLVWYVDGVEVQRDEIRVPQVDHYFMLTREMNSGVQRTTAQEEANPHLPNDTGIWTPTSVWPGRNGVNVDEGYVDFVKVWDVTVGEPQDDPAPAVDAPIEIGLINARTDQDVRWIQDGDTFSRDTARRFNIQVVPEDSTARSVRIQLSGPRSANRVENVEPYAAFGDRGGDYFGRSLTPGTYTLTAEVYSRNGARGSQLAEHTIQFTVT